MAKSAYSPNLKLQDESLSEDIKFELLKHTMGSKPNIKPADTGINTLDLNESEISNSLSHETPLLINKSNVEENIENNSTKEINFEVASEYRSDEESQENDTEDFEEKSQEEIFDSSTKVTITPSNGPTFKKMNISYDKDEDTSFDSIELIKKQNREVPEFYYQGPQIKEYQGDNTNPNIKLNTATNRQYIPDQKVKKIEKYVGEENFPIMNPIMTINKPINISQSTVTEVNPAFNTLGSMGSINHKIIIPSLNINPVPTQNFVQAPINNKPKIIVKDSMIKKPKILTSKEGIIPNQKEIIQLRPEIMQLTKKVIPIRNKAEEQKKVIPVPVKKVIAPIKKKVEVIPAIKKLSIPKIPNKTVKYISKPLTMVKQPPPMLQVINRMPTPIGHIQKPKLKLVKSKLRKRLIPVVTKKPKKQKSLATEKGFKLNNSRSPNEVRVKELKIIEPSRVVIKEIKPIPVKSQLMKQNTIKEQNFNQPNIIIQSNSHEKPQFESGILNEGILNYPLLSSVEFGIPNFQPQQLRIPDAKVMGETFDLNTNKALPSIPGRSYSNQASWYRQSTILFILMIIIVVIGLGCFFLFYFSR
ncbi:uncharacterized protein CMU_022180 [Cryptosporidium muris RN66]|uniref:Uncharacterized protein n=1 Tax=Cryptosporidium muris (strain RN66) TaxID=441375 RepID=B6AK45_CRYMR|nr:uncharacterized protein CMU_022180 [Cryptosporidium muris RN66]EEA08586.1 hypothetical protein, conserved [Cryptosporidium muris RN66]|eukprot:XP_002142935.1 hypothetical protein [Cryptosporidium muris RN66]